MQKYRIIDADAHLIEPESLWQEYLEPEFRAVFVLRDIEEFSTEETATAMGISVPAVKSRLLRARLKLRKKLNRYFRQGEPN